MLEILVVIGIYAVAYIGIRILSYLRQRRIKQPVEGEKSDNMDNDV